MAGKAKNGKASSAKANGAKAKKAAAPKPSAEKLNDQELQALLLQHVRKITPLITAANNAKAAVTKAYELAKKEGVTKKEIDLALKLRTDEGREKVAAEIARDVRVARWVGADLGTQFDMFAPQTKADKDFEAGKLAALSDEPRKPPKHLSNAASERWMKGHAEGSEFLNEQRLSGFKPIADVVAGSKIGTQPATHATTQ